jgi:phosphoribosyl 1,2-cyclic phosphodiesterase
VNYVIDILPVKPSNVIETVDAEYQVVTTNRTADSVGYIVNAGKSLAYLFDTFSTPKETVDAILDIDHLVFDALLGTMTAEEDILLHFSVDEAIDF